MTKEDFLTLFTEDEMERLAHAGVTLRRLEETWERFRTEAGEELKALDPSIMRRRIIERSDKELMEMLRRAKCSPTIN